MLVFVHSPSCRDELRADLAEFEEKVDNITVSNPRVAQEYRWEGGGSQAMGQPSHQPEVQCVRHAAGG